MGRVPEVELSSRQKMPLIGLGTGAHPFPPPELLESTILKEIKLGYRHFDTASIYQTEQPLGLAISQALRRGLISNRDELFVTSKLWCTDAHSDLVLPAIRETLQALGLEYVDLYLIHFPVRLKEGEKRVNFSKDDILPFDVRPTWEAMEECHRLGLARSIGVSNFSSKKLQQLLAHATIPPAVNQVEMNVGWQQRKLRDFCKENGIHVSAWSPLGAKGSWWGTPAVMESPVLKEIAKAKGKTVAQVALRWIYEQGASIVVKSFNEERMKENLSIFDWALTDRESESIIEIPQQSSPAVEIVFVSPDGPYKSPQELWDGEL